ncbi:MAG: hypothetical protein CMA05_04845 [Euryarchaeota archaeon]|nr:hypothetical protein [Euryarchaeota archaeon]
MKWTPHDERPEAVIILANTMSADIKSAYPNWGAKVVGRRTPLGYMYDVVTTITPTMEEAMLPEELR